MASPLPTKAVLTANDVRTGDIVFWTAQHDWTTDIKKACVGKGAVEAQALLDAAQKEEGENRVVGSYLIALQAGDSLSPIPLKLREIRRLAGPSVPFGLPEAKAEAK
ncbi:MAG TPA: hypothetical protein DCR05_08970, partial [Alphaproteobacteria bacterium]|nr:hypothetical protein [Alphaproteobacteria bacterium]